MDQKRSAYSSTFAMAEMRMTKAPIDLVSIGALQTLGERFPGSTTLVVCSRADLEDILEW